MCSSIKRVADKAKVYAPYANPQKTRDDATPRTIEKELMAIIESLQKHIKELKFEGARIEQPAKEPVAWMRSALDNARDVCKYLDHDMVKEAKAHTQFFWNDLDKIREFDNTHQQQMTGKDDD